MRAGLIDDGRGRCSRRPAAGRVGAATSQVEDDGEDDDDDGERGANAEGSEPEAEGRDGPHPTTLEETK